MNKKSKKNDLIDVKEFIFQKSNFLSSIKLMEPFKTKILIDTGAEEINVISNNHYLKYLKVGDCTKIQKCNQIVVPMGGQPLKTLGAIDLKLSLGNEMVTEDIPFIVVESLSQIDIILGLRAIQQLNIIPKLSEGIVEILGKNYQLIKNSFVKHAEVRLCGDAYILSGKQVQVRVKFDEEIF